MIEPEGTLPRCPHSIYLATEKERVLQRAHFCFLCNPSLIGCDPNADKKFVLPKIYSFNEKDRPIRATPRLGACPACGSTIHEEISRKTWRCADCNEEFKAPRLRSEAA